ncbi:hypothetical protein HKX48_000068 [Thoreauomyces humboldtii]|nr:hypothetical protein HKX48_000068 [Thoreauomyces humboldtii]
MTLYRISALPSLLIALTASTLAAAASAKSEAANGGGGNTAHFGSIDEQDDEDILLPIRVVDEEWSEAGLFVSGGEFAQENMYWVLPVFLFLLLANVVYFVWAAGRLVKPSVVSVRAVRLPTLPVAAAWRILSEWQNYPDWRADVVSVAPAKTKGRWTEVGHRGSRYEYEVLEEDEKTLLQVRSGTPLPPPGGRPAWSHLYTFMSPKWTVEVRAPCASTVEAPATGCLVYVSEEMSISAPAVRFIMAMWGHGRHVDRFLNDLIILAGDRTAKVQRPVGGTLIVEGDGTVPKSKEIKGNKKKDKAAAIKSE